MANTHRGGDTNADALAVSAMLVDRRETARLLGVPPKRPRAEAERAKSEGVSHG